MGKAAAPPGPVAVDQDAGQARTHGAALFLPAHRVRGRTHPFVIRGIAGGVRRQQTAPLRHHAKAAEPEHFQLDTGLPRQLPDLRQRQHARQYHAADTEALAHQLDGVTVRGRALHGQVQAQAGVALAGVAQQPGVSHDDRVRAQPGGSVDGVVPLRHGAHLRKGIDGEQDLRAPGMRLGHAGPDIVLGKVETAEVAGIGGIAQAEVDGVGTMLQSHAQCRQRARGRHQLGLAHGPWRGGLCRTA